MSFKILKEKNLSKGQTLIETLILSLVFIGLTQFIMFLCWMFINFIWIEHQLYQAILCIAQQKERRVCESHLINNINKLGHLGEVSSFHIDSKKGRLLWRFYKYNFLIKQNLNLSQ